MPADVMSRTADMIAAMNNPDKGVETGEYENVKELRRGFKLHWSIVGDNIKMALEAQARNQWIGVAISKGGMVGSNAVVGWDNGSDNQKVQDYLLFGKLPWMLTTSEKQAISDETISTVGGSTVLRFTRPLAPEGANPILKGAKTMVLYARGIMPKVTDDFFRVHSFREYEEIEFL